MLHISQAEHQWTVQRKSYEACLKFQIEPHINNYENASQVGGKISPVFISTLINHKNHPYIPLMQQKSTLEYLKTSHETFSTCLSSGLHDKFFEKFFISLSSSLQCIPKVNIAYFAKKTLLIWVNKVLVLLVCKRRPFWVQVM